MSILIGIPYQTMHVGSGLINLSSSAGNASAKQRIKCNWDDALSLGRGILGWTFNTGSGVWVASRTLQHFSVAGWYATDVNIQPHGRPVGPSRWTKALLDVIYKPAEFLATNSTDFRDEQLDFSGEMVDLGSVGWTFSGTTETVNKPITKLVPMISYNITQYHVGVLPVSTMYSLLGTLNNATWKGASIANVMYVGGSANRKIIAVNTNGTIVNDWTVNHKFLVANRNLNTEWRTSTGAFAQIVGPGSATKFALGDFSLLNLGV